MGTSTFAQYTVMPEIALARISRVIRVPGIAEMLRQKRTPAEIAAVLKEADAHLAMPV